MRDLPIQLFNSGLIALPHCAPASFKAIANGGQSNGTFLTLMNCQPRAF